VRGVDEPLVATETSRSNCPHPNPLARHADARPARAAVSWSIHESPTSNASGGSTPASPASASSASGDGLRGNPASRDHTTREAVEAEVRHEPISGVLRLVRQDGHGRTRRRATQHLLHAVVGLVWSNSIGRRSRETPATPRPATRRARPRERPRNQHRAPSPHHAGDIVGRQRAPAVAGDERVGGVREVAPRVDQRAVQVEDDSARRHRGPQRAPE